MGKVYNNLYVKILSKKKDLLFAMKWTFISFFIVHGAFFINRFANEDYLHYSYKNGSVPASGRFVGNITNLMNSWTVGVISAFIFGITIFLVLDMIKINSSFMKMLSIFILVSFPSLSTSFGYLFMAQVYSIALFFAVIGVYITDKFKFGFIVGSVCIMLSLGAYQSYISVAMTLSVIIILRNWYLYQPMRVTQNQFYEILKFMLMGMLGILLYIVVIKKIYPIMEIQLNTYKGLNNMGTINLSDVPMLIKRTYVGVWDFINGDRFFSATKLQYFVNIFTIVLIIYHLMLKIISSINRNYDIIAIASIILMPFCVNVVDFMAPQTHASVLNTYAFSYIYILLIALYEWEKLLVDKEVMCFSGQQSIIKDKYLGFITSAMIAMTIFSNIVISSAYYLKIDATYEASVLFDNRLYARIESIEGYNKNMPVAIIASSGSFYVHSDEQYPEIIEDTGIWQKFIGFNNLGGTRLNYATGRMVKMMNNTLNVDVVEATPEQIHRIVNSQEYKEMGIYPSSDGIRIIDGIMVVNFDAY